MTPSLSPGNWLFLNLNNIRSLRSGQQLPGPVCGIHHRSGSEVGVTFGRAYMLVRQQLADNSQVHAI